MGREVWVVESRRTGETWDLWTMHQKRIEAEDEIAYQGAGFALLPLAFRVVRYVPEEP